MEEKTTPLGYLAGRGIMGGVLMGLANLVPGISGGTMLLAAGIYTDFINAVAEVTTFRFRKRSLVVLASVVLAAGCAIILLAGVVKNLVVDHRWLMYSVFIGLTLGGVPVIWKLIRRATKGVWVGAVSGFALMAVLAIAQQQQPGASADGVSNTLMLGVAGVAGASAMILPGVSGGYLLLVLGQYIPILTAIDTLKEGLRAGDPGTVLPVVVGVVLPVGIGVLIGVVGVSNLLRLLLRRYEKPTLGVLLGLLLGAVVGLWPFQQGVAPSVGDTFKGRTLTTELLAEVEPEDSPTEYFRPRASQVFGALGAIVAGFGVTLGVSRIGGSSRVSSPPPLESD
jgi:putative membrane protein